MNAKNRPLGDSEERRSARYRKSQVIFSQGDPADAVGQIQEGHVKLSVVSAHGKEAVIGILGPGDFLGEGCLVDRPLRTAIAVALSECSVLWLGKAEVNRTLQKQSKFRNAFLAHLLSRNIRLEEDLADQIANSSEQRLARVLLLLASSDKKGEPERVNVKLSQETLANMIGTTRSRVSYFMNKFRKLGFIDYKGGLKVRSSLRSILPDD